MSNNFKDVMSNNSDAQLIKIVTSDRQKYNPEALIAAEEEIEKRNLSFKDLEIAKETVQKQETQQSKIKEEPLGTVQKILFFIFFWGVLPWLLAYNYKADGYERKYKEAWKAIKYGLITWIISFLIVISIIKFVF